MPADRSAFDRLRSLLSGLTPPAGADPIALHLGESRLVTPDVDVTPLAYATAWTRYPPLGGTAELHAAYTAWLERRFAAPGLASRLAIEPTPGSKQAISALVALACAGGPDAAVVLPNPYYPTYLAAVRAAGARPVPYTLDDPHDTAPVAAAVRACRGRVAAIVVCSPGTPRGEILPPATLRAVTELAASAGALLVVDECYVDLYVDAAPVGYLSLLGDLVSQSYVVLHTLSKRSGMPGLRSGFAAGDPSTVDAYAGYNRSCGVSTAAPVCAVAAALWADEAHVREGRAALARNWALADELLCDVPGYRRAGAGFFVWLPVADDEATARRLWREHGLSVMPGRYLAVDGPDGANPGADHLRIALVHEEARMREALNRLRNALPATAAGGARPRAAARPGGGA